MTFRVVTPAPMREVLDLFAATTPMKPVNAKAAVLQLARSETVGYYAGAELVAAAMYYPLPPEQPGEDLRELAFVCRPSFRHYLIPFARHARSMRAALASNGPVRVRALVRRGHAPGRRLAVLCGLSWVCERGAFDVWEFEGGPDGQVRRGDQVAVQRRQQQPQGRRTGGADHG